MKELEWVDLLRTRVRKKKGVLTAIGDDCALVKLGTQLMLLKSDLFIEGVHFKRGKINFKTIGARAVGRVLSDFAACGGGAKLDGMIGLARAVFKLPSSLGRPREVQSAIDKIDDPSLATAVGLVRWGEQFMTNYGQGGGLFNKFSAAGDVSDKVKKWFKSFLP